MHCYIIFFSGDVPAVQSRLDGACLRAGRRGENSICTVCTALLHACTLQNIVVDVRIAKELLEAERLQPVEAFLGVLRLAAIDDKLFWQVGNVHVRTVPLADRALAPAGEMTWVRVY